MADQRRTWRESRIKKCKSHSRVNSPEWLNVAGRRMGIPYREYSCMPVGELSDLYDFWLAQEGLVDLIDRRDTQYFPGGV